MASIRPRGKVYYFTITDETGRRVERRGCSDYRETERMAAMAEAKVARINLGLSTPREEEHAEAAVRPIGDLLDEWSETLRARECQDHHVKLVKTRAEALIRLAEARTLRELKPSKLQKGIKALCERGKSNRTANHYLRAVKNFMNWLIDEGMFDRDLTRQVKKYPETKEHRILVRRLLTREQAAELLSAVDRSQRRRYHLAGADRAWVYRIALMTGYRADEIRSLTRESFRLDREIPSIDLPGTETKNGEPAVQPLPLSSIGPLRAWLAGRPKAGPIVRLTRETSKMLQYDLAEAGIPFLTDEGQVDFHALRVAYSSWLVESGADVKTAQTLLRHSDPRLTIGLYSKTHEGSLCRAVQALAVPLPCAGVSGSLPESPIVSPG